MGTKTVTQIATEIYRRSITHLPNFENATLNKASMLTLGEVIEVAETYHSQFTQSKSIEEIREDKKQVNEIILSQIRVGKDMNMSDYNLATMIQAELELKGFAPYLSNTTKFELCPKCLGEGVCNNIGLSGSSNRICPVCNGKMVLSSNTTRVMDEDKLYY